jgi:hypothetical protein
MGIEHPEFQRRLIRKIKQKDHDLAKLYARTCEKDGVQANASTGICHVCGRQVFQVERDPIPDDVQRFVDPAKAALQRQFYTRLETQRRERERAAAEAERKKNVTLLPGESLPGDPPKRDWARYLDQHGYPRRLS